RSRAILTQEHSSVCNRIQKILEDANIKLGSVASDVFGVSGRAMLRALMKGEKDPEVLADLSKRALRNKIPQLRRALDGQVTEHHRSLLTGHWNRMEFLERQIADFEKQIAERIKSTPEETALTMPNTAIEDAVPLSAREQTRVNGGSPPHTGHGLPHAEAQTSLPGVGRRLLRHDQPR